jgi:hypothetical protein
VTALPPLETRQVKGMLAARYEANRTCSHPECVEPVPDRGHHIFPRSQIGNGNYFVQAWDADGKEMFAHPIPHVTGLCRAHHDAVERHDAWIKYEDGSFVWYDRMLYQCRDCLVGDGLNGVPKELASRCSDCQEDWTLLGPLDPQPAGREKVRKPKRARLKGEDVAKRKTVTIKLPEGVDGVYWDELLAEAETIEQAQEDTQYEQWRGGIAKGKLLVAVLERFTGRAG